MSAYYQKNRINSHLTAYSIEEEAMVDLFCVLPALNHRWDYSTKTRETSKVYQN